jgi:hypothetical protein
LRGRRRRSGGERDLGEKQTRKGAENQSPSQLSSIHVVSLLDDLQLQFTFILSEPSREARDAFFQIDFRFPVELSPS